MIFKRIFIIVFVLVSLLCLSLPTSAMQIDIDAGDEVFLRSSSNIQSITVEFSVDGGLKNYIMNFSVGSYIDDIDLEFDTSNCLCIAETLHETEGNVTTWYEGHLYTVYNVLQRDVNDNAQIASDFQFEFYKYTYTNAGGEPSEISEEVEVNFEGIELQYGTNELHADALGFRYRHSGVGSPYLIATGTNGSTWDVSFSTQLITWEYTRVRNNSGSVDYTNVDRDRHNYYQEHVNLDPRGGIGCYRSYSELVSQGYSNSIIFDTQGSRQMQTLNTQYRYIVAQESVFKAYTNSVQSGDFVLTFIDWYDRATLTNVERMPLYYDEYAYGSISNFDVGSFLAESVNAFLDIEIAPDFTLGELGWTIFGILAVLAIGLMLAGK